MSGGGFESNVLTAWIDWVAWVGWGAARRMEPTVRHMNRRSLVLFDRTRIASFLIAIR